MPTPFGVVSYRFLGQKFPEKKKKRGHRWFALHLPSCRKRAVDEAFVALPCSDPCNYLLK